MRAAIFPRGSLTLEVNKMQLKVASYGIKRTNLSLETHEKPLLAKATELSRNEQHLKAQKL